jgi:hypothetical protein
MRHPLRNLSIEHFRHLWNVRHDFTKLHLLKSLLFNWWPCPDRFFQSSSLMDYIREHVVEGGVDTKV